MIFVTVGGELPFDRLVRAMDAFAAAHPGEDFLAQIGAGRLRAGAHALAAHARARRPMPRRSPRPRLVVAHAGIGSVLSAGEHGKPIVLLPRQARLGEHRNDHQRDTVAHLAGRPGIFVAADEAELPARIAAARAAGAAGTARSPPTAPAASSRGCAPSSLEGRRQPGAAGLTRPRIIRSIPGIGRPAPRARRRRAARRSRRAGSRAVSACGQRAAGRGGGQRPVVARPRRVEALERELGLGAVELHLGVAGHRLGGRAEVVERLGRVAAQVQDPAVGVLERRHVRAAQPPGDAEGALEALGVGPGGGDAGSRGCWRPPARRCRGRRAPRRARSRPRGRPRPRRGPALGEHQLGVAGARARARRRAPPPPRRRARSPARKPAQARCAGGEARRVGDQRPVAGLGGRGVAGGGVEPGDAAAAPPGCRDRRPARRRASAAGAGRVAGLEAGAHQRRHRAGVAAVAGELLEQRQGLRGAALAGEARRLEPGRRRAAAAGSSEAASSAATWPARAQSRRARWISPSVAKSSGSSGARRSASTTTASAGPVRSSCIRKRGVAQRFRRRPVRGLDGAGELLAGELARALRARRRAPSPSAPRRRAAPGRARCACPAPPPPGGRRRSRAWRAASAPPTWSRSRGEHGRRRAPRSRVGGAGLGQHPGEAGLEVAGGVRGLGALEQPAHRRDRRVGVAGGEVERGAGAAERARGRRPRRPAGRARRGRPPARGPRAGSAPAVSAGPGSAGVRAAGRRRAQHRLGGVRVAPARGATAPARARTAAFSGKSAGHPRRARRRCRPCRRARRASRGGRGAAPRRRARGRGPRRSRPSASAGAPAASRSATSTICAGTEPGSSATTPAAIATAAARASPPLRKSTVAFSARTPGSAGAERVGLDGVRARRCRSRRPRARARPASAGPRGASGPARPGACSWLSASPVSPRSRSSPA